MQQESLGKIFDAFFSTKAEGMGIGLSISRSIIESHQGKISARTHEKGGAEFAFELPVIIVTGHADVAMAVRAMKAGAFDFIEKPYNDALMLERVQSAITYDQNNRHDQQHVAAIKACASLLTPRKPDGKNAG